MSKVKAMKLKKEELFMPMADTMSVAKVTIPERDLQLRYLVKREPTFWKKGIKVLQFHNGVEWLDVPKVRTVK